MLLFPPQWVPYQPYLSLPSLSAYLQQHGIEVIQKDLNIESLDQFLSEDFLLNLDTRLDNEFQLLDSSKKPLSKEEQQYYNDLFIANSALRQIAANITPAKDVFRSEEQYFHAGVLSSARKTIQQALGIISTAYFPTRIEMAGFDMRAYTRSYEDLEQSTQDRAQNPYISLFEDKFIPEILAANPDVIGISIAGDSQLIPALTLSRLLKKHNSKAHIVIGGYVVTLLAESIVKYEGFFHTFFDSAIVQEGELPLLKLVQSISSGGNLADVPNLIYCDKTPKVNDVASPPNINRLPCPSFEGMPFDHYFSPKPVLPLLASRGCYWGKCAFCSHNESYGWRYQSRAADKVIEDLQTLKSQYHCRDFTFVDEGLAPKLADQLSAEILKENLEVNISSNSRLEPQFTPELCLKMRKAGFRLLTVGLESGCDRILSHMSKGINTQTASEVLNNIFQADIWNHLYMFFGFPTETNEEAQTTIDFLQANKNIIRSFNIGNFDLYKGSDTKKNPLKYGISEVIDDNDISAFSMAYNYSVTTGLSNIEAKNLSVTAWDRLVCGHKSKQVFEFLSLNDILPYLAHFGPPDALVNLVLKVQTVPKPTSKRVKRFSIPILSEDLIWTCLNYDITNIQQNLVNGIGCGISPTSICVTYSLKDKIVTPVSSSCLEILELCDGKNTVKQISIILAEKYSMPSRLIEVDCIAFLQQIADLQLLMTTE